MLKFLIRATDNPFEWIAYGRTIIQSLKTSAAYLSIARDCVWDRTGTVPLKGGFSSENSG